MAASRAISFGPDQWVREPELLENNHGHTYVEISKREVGPCDPIGRYETETYRLSRAFDSI